MPSFCQYCGSSVQDNQVCNCPQSVQARNAASQAPQQPQQAQPVQYQPQQAQYQQPQQPQYQQQPYQQPYPQQPVAPVVPRQPSAAGKMFADLGKYFLGIFIKPMSTAKNACDNFSLPQNLILLGGQTFLASLAGLLFFVRVPDMPIGEIFLGYFYCILASAGFTALLAVALMLFSMIFKKKVDFKKSLSIVAASSGVVTWFFSFLVLAGVSAGVYLFGNAFLLGFFMMLAVGVSLLSALLMFNLYKDEESSFDSSVIPFVCSYAATVLTIVVLFGFLASKFLYGIMTIVGGVGMGYYFW